MKVVLIHYSAPPIVGGVESVIGHHARLMADAGHEVRIEEAGAFAIVLEGVPAQLSQEITEKLSIPTIGIGAGPDCDGQVLVINDMLGLTGNKVPKFVKRYADLRNTIFLAASEFVKDVEEGSFPYREHSY